MQKQAASKYHHENDGADDGKTDSFNDNALLSLRNEKWVQCWLSVMRKRAVNLHYPHA